MNASVPSGSEAILFSKHPNLFKREVDGIKGVDFHIVLRYAAYVLLNNKEQKTSVKTFLAVKCLHSEYFL